MLAMWLLTWIGLEPPFEGYWRTEKALAEYVKLAGQDDGEVLPATKKPVEPSDQYPGAQRLERLLRLVGDLRPNNTLVEALKRFQIRHGIEPDGLHRQGHVEAIEYAA